MKIGTFKKLLPLLALGCFAGTAQAQLVITEVMSSGSDQDWFEVTNYGASTVSLTGYTMDDSSASTSTDVALNGVASIAVGESVIFLEGTSGNAADFATAWGLSGVQVGYYSGGGVGLGAGGDGVALFNASGTLLAKVSFGSATEGYSFYYGSTSVPGTLTDYTLSAVSVAGVAGAFTGSTTSDVGSPGTSAVPEPSTYAALAGAVALGLAFWRRRRA